MKRPSFLAFLGLAPVAAPAPVVRALERLAHTTPHVTGLAATLARIASEATTRASFEATIAGRLASILGCSDDGVHKALHLHHHVGEHFGSRI